MLEVGNFMGPNNLTESKTHFGGWCIVSAPLILGMDVTDSANLDAVWPIISNKESINLFQNMQRFKQPELPTACFQQSGGYFLT